MLLRLTFLAIAVLLSAQPTDFTVFEAQAWNDQTLITKAAYVYGWYGGFGAAKGLALRKNRIAAQDFEGCIKRLTHRQVVLLVESYLAKHPTVRREDIGIVMMAAFTEACGQ